MMKKIESFSNPSPGYTTEVADNGIASEEIVRDYQIQVDIDQILSCQGADPAALRRRRPDIICLAEEVLAREWRLVKPVILYRYYPVRSFTGGTLFLDGGGRLRGSVITQNLAVAEAVVVMIATIGPEIDRRISESYSQKPSYALAVDGLGTAAVDTLRKAAERTFQEQAESRGWRLSRFLVPGMDGWEIREGQRQVFSLLEAEKIGVDLMFSGQMIPLKSNSGVLGMGSQVECPTCSSCELCSLRETCIYKDGMWPVSLANDEH